MSAAQPLASPGAAPGAEPFGEPLDGPFFARSVHEVAADLVGCALLFDAVGGVIVETESYDASDPACHAYGGITPRSEVLFGPPGRAYVYFSYGVHSLLNFVAEPEGEAAAVLIRALEPLRSIDAMRARRGVERIEDLCSGPGKLTQALGVGLELNGVSLREGPIRVLARAGRWRRPRIVTAPRIGISKATELPWRFCAEGHPCVSRPRPRDAR